MNFASDNTAPAHDAVIAAIARHNKGAMPAYGDDALSQTVQTAIANLFEHDAQTLLLATGTAANAIAIAAYMQSYGMVLCHKNAHIQVDECGAPEMFAGGAKTLVLDGAAGKIAPAELARFLDKAWRGVVHRTQPMVLSLTQLSECGTAYDLGTTAELCALAHAHGMIVHMDGARFANAMVGLGATPAEMTWKAGVDIVSFGASKNGTLGCEAIVAFDPSIGQKLQFLRKRGGHLFSKMRLLAAQFDAYLADDLWIKNATHANAMAQRLAAGLAHIPEITPVFAVDGNQVFVTIPDAIATKLHEQGFVFYDWQDEGADVHRFVCSWDTKPRDVDALIAQATRLSQHYRNAQESIT